MISGGKNSKQLSESGEKQQNLIITLAFFVYSMAYFGRYSFKRYSNYAQIIEKEKDIIFCSGIKAGKIKYI